MEVQVVVVDALALVDEQAERDVERLLAGAADPEVAVALLVHGDQALLEDARPEHQVVDPEAGLAGEPARGDGDGLWTAGGGGTGAHGATSAFTTSPAHSRADAALSDRRPLTGPVSAMPAPPRVPLTTSTPRAPGA